MTTPTKRRQNVGSIPPEPRRGRLPRPRRERKRFRKGDPVEYVGLPGLGPARHSHGTVAGVAGVKGKSVHPDPSRLMTFVQWDDGHGEGVFTAHLARVKKKPAKRRS